MNVATEQGHMIPVCQYFGSSQEIFVTVTQLLKSELRITKKKKTRKKTMPLISNSFSFFFFFFFFFFFVILCLTIASCYVSC